MKSPIYLVPFDFSEVSENALRFALDVAVKNNGLLVLVHIVSKKSERAAARERFRLILSQFSDSEQEIMDAKVLVGDIYSDIAKASEVLGASLIVMGTHGAKGMQKLFGSHALRLVSSTSTPFIITQGQEPLRPIGTIVMPFNFEKESIQIAGFAAQISKQFNATIHLVGFHDKDAWLDKRIKSNQLVIRRFFEENGVSYELTNLPDRKTYQEELMVYALQVDATLIAAAFFNDSIIPPINSFVQELIENENRIPILTVNAEELTITSGYSFMTV